MGTLSVNLLFFMIASIAYIPVYESVICTFNICSLYPCLNGGTCYRDENCNARCKCPSTYGGIRCGVWNNQLGDCVNKCKAETCNFHGNCSFNKEICSTKCECEPDFDGSYCDRKKCGLMGCAHGTCNKIDDISYHCECDPGWNGVTCNIQCTRNCSNGFCFFKNGEEMCACKEKYLPESNCTEVEPLPMGSDWDRDYLWFLAIPIFLSLLLALMLFVLWKFRFIVVLRIIYMFQHYEDKDGKEYDAFISFRSSSPDENWTFKTLFPVLESEMGFKVCIHTRDFVVGETISNNIISAIEKSRRTILVLSPDYVISEWTRMEYQVAHQEMLKKHHKIIPIIFRSIDSIDIDKNLSYIIKSITYLEWPESDENDENKIKKFWQKLRLTMPKKKETKQNELKGNIERPVV
ncbi:uncharacterized protein LOC115215177 isoform X1 [Argonauta hians]